MAEAPTRSKHEPGSTVLRIAARDLRIGGARVDDLA